ncbi:hypothetical protein SAMN05892883_2416 [Jatrophihabitans sp. GAS493]|nr:hypothetical protein SAMN05892883_2416 [Jatrophihabitans sp. GAS493]
MVPPILAVFAALSRLYAAQSGSGSQVLTVTVRVSGATHAYIAESAALSTASTGLRFAPVLVGCAAVAVLATLLAVLGKPKTRRFGLASLFTLFGLLSGLSIAMWLSTWSGELASFGAASSHLSIGPGAWLASGAALVQGAAAVTLARPSARRLE